MPDFLLELRSEEIPARMQASARASLEKLFREQLAAAGVAVGAVTVWSTPRRLALVATGLPEATAAVSEEVKGPRVGAPPQALEGFLRKTGLTADQLTEKNGVLFAVTQKPGRATKDVLAEAIPAICRAFPWPKSMRWGAASISTESLRWVRPLSGIVALFGDDLVECEVGGVRSGCATLGHRFHHPGEITIGNAHDYVEKLRACHVLVDHVEREGIVRARAKTAAEAAGLVLVEDEGLVIENAGLTEWPVPLLGRFDAAFLEVPPEVIQLTARTNQKYFICRDGAGQLANAFVCTANIEARDGGEAIVAGNRKVLAARLSDARFFWEQDRKTSLAEHATRLERITFHEKLGSVADKVERVAKLARWLVETGIVGSSPERGGGPAKLVEGQVLPGAPSPREDHSLVPLHHPADGPPPRSGEELADMAEQAARLCKADLVTEMVGEFPELQGLMGGYYARAEGLPDAVADAIRDHYKPVGQGDDVPTAPVTVAVALADKLDSLAMFYAVDLKPTGSKDPFALRRAALGSIELILTNQLRFKLRLALARATLQPVMQRFSDAAEAKVRLGIEAFRSASGLAEPMKVDEQFEKLAMQLNVSSQGIEISEQMNRGIFDVVTFFADRLKVQQREAGVRHDLIDAVFALGGEDDLVRLLAQVHALQAFVGTDDGTNLLAGYKRAANILRKEDWQGIESRIPRNADEDPMSNVDDPAMRAVALARIELLKDADYPPEPAEAALIAALDAAEPAARAAVEAEDFAGAMAALAALRAPIDAFFETVTVNDADANKRAARLDLLARFRDAVHHVADFSRIEG